MNCRVALLTVATLAAFLFTGFAGAQGNGPGPGQGPGPGSNQQKLITYFNSLPMQSLDATEIASLRQMIQEEKLARDVYLALDYIWKMPIFKNIAKAEQEHMDLVRLVYKRYNLPDPAVDDRIGVFPDQLYSNLFIFLVTFGMQSQQYALWVGNAIEDLDINDLMTELKKTDNRDIKTIYQNLLKGSRNHLRAFYPTLLKFNGTYKPIFLNQTLFTQIVTSPHETNVVYDENGVALP